MEPGKDGPGVEEPSTYLLFPWLFSRSSVAWTCSQVTLGTRRTSTQKRESVKEQKASALLPSQSRTHGLQRLLHLKKYILSQVFLPKKSMFWRNGLIHGG